MDNPFCDITDPEQLLSLVQDGEKCRWCGGSGVYTGEDDRLHIKIKCTTCHGTGLVPLSNADLDALAACWCEGEWVQCCKRHPTTKHKRPGWYRYKGYGSWQLVSKRDTYPRLDFTTDPVAAMRLQVQYHLDVDWLDETSGIVYEGLSSDPTRKHTDFMDSELCHAFTTAALIVALTEAMEGASE